MQPSLSAQILLIADEDLKVTRATESTCVGRTRAVQARPLDDLLGASLPDSIPGLDSAEALDACRTILSGGRFPGGFAAYRKGIIVSDSGPERRVFLLSPKLDDARVCGIICRVSRTFLQFPQADDLTAESYQSMVENCMEFMFVIDELGFHTYVSPMIRATMGENPDNVYGMHMSDVVHPDDIERCQSILDSMIDKSNPATDIQYRLTLPDGTLRHIAVSGHRFDTGGGVRYMGIAKDITETMELRAKLQARQEALAALSNIVLTLSSRSNLANALQSALAEILAFLRLDNGGINVLSADGSEQIAGAVIGTPKPAIPPQVLLEHLDALCPKPGQIQIIRDVASDSRLSEMMRAGLQAIGVQGFVLARFQSMLGQHACMAMDIPAHGELSVEQIEFLNLATGILGPAVENAVLQGELADRANQLEMLERMALSINSGLDVRSIFTACQTALRDVIDSDVVCLVVFGANGMADVYAFHGEDDMVRDRTKLTHQQMQAFGAMHEAHVWSSPGEAQKHQVQHHDRPIDTGSSACAPLVYKGEVTGLLKIWSHKEDVFGRREVSILQTVAEHLSIAVANVGLYEAEHAKTLELEALGREMQHRIKNNLQSIAGLLSISSEDGEQSARALDRCLGQVRAMSTVHSLLAPRHLASGTRLRRLLREVAQAAVVAAGRSEEIQVTIAGNNPKLTPDTAVALGVIVNELVSNSIEHGLSGRDAGEISIKTSSEQTCTVVELSDDGVGLPSGFKSSREAKSGLGLVASLVEYGLHGEFTISRSDSGTVARIQF